MSLHEAPLEYKDKKGNVYEGVLCYNKQDSAKRPGVLVLPAFRGVTEFEVERAKALAKIGYVALAVDVFGKGVPRSTKEECFAVVRPLTAGDRAELSERLLAARDALAQQSYVDEQKIAAIGYCLGGLCALDLARRRAPGLVAAVSFHGTLKPIPDTPNEKFDAKIQVHNGQADTHIGKEQVEGFYAEMNERQADWHYVEHSYAQHGFTEPDAASLGLPGVAYNEKAANRSWKMALGFLEEAFH